MRTYLIAGLKVNMDPFGRTEEQAEKYRTDFCDSADILISPSERAISGYADRVGTGREDGYYLASGFDFYRKLLAFDGFMLHSSAVCVDGEAFLFSGQSGVGKSTHTSLWQKLLGDRCSVLNDDKPALRLADGTFYAYGTPWSGKHDKSINIGVPVKAVCFITRGSDNEIIRLSEKQAAIHIINQCPKNFDEKGWDKILSLIDGLVKSVSVYKLVCNTDISAAKLSFGTMSGGEI